MAVELHRIQKIVRFVYLSRFLLQYNNIHIHTSHSSTTIVIHQHAHQVHTVSTAEETEPNAASSRASIKIKTPGYEITTPPSLIAENVYHPPFKKPMSKATLSKWKLW